MRPPSFSPTSAQTVLTEFVSAVVRSITPNDSPPEFCSGTPEIGLLLRPSTCEPGSERPVSSAAAAVTTFIVDPGG